jgi:hypothetical protein
MQASAESGISAFLTKWPPSATPAAQYDWITASHGNHSEATQENRERLKAAFESLVAARTPHTVTQDEIKELARRHHIRSGKWMIYQQPKVMDELWGNVVRNIVPTQGYAKVSTVRGRKSPVCCVNVRDFNDELEMKSVRERLRDMKVQNAIIFKLDAFTFLDLYEGNQYGIPIEAYRL